MADELERVRSSFRAELVPSARAKLELVRAADARSPFPTLPQRPNSKDGPGGKDAA